MGCTPSRQIGLRHDPFHSSVVPMGLYPGMDTWTRAPFVADVSHTQPLPRAAEDPPPYTEVAIDGHISLIHGRSSPLKHDDRMFHQPMVNNSSIVSIHEGSSFMDTSHLGNDSSLYVNEGNEEHHLQPCADYQTDQREYAVEEVFRSTSPLHDQSYGSRSCETSQLSWSFSGYQDLHIPPPPEPRRSSSPYLRDVTISQSHSNTVFPRPPSRSRAQRSQSIDTATLSVQHGTINEPELRAALTPSPPLADHCVSVRDSEDSMSHQGVTVVNVAPHDRLSGLKTEFGPFPVRPMRLPPLQHQHSYQEDQVNNGSSTTEPRKAHRKRKKRRKRGHSWHGEAVAELAAQSLTTSTNNNSMTPVVE